MTGPKLYNMADYQRRKVETGGGGTHDGGMEARVAKLEEHVGAIRVSIATIEERLNHMPRTATLWRAVATAAGLVIAGLWAIIAIWGKPWLIEIVKNLNVHTQ